MQRTKFIPTPIGEELLSEWQSEQSILLSAVAEKTQRAGEYFVDLFTYK